MKNERNLRIYEKRKAGISVKNIQAEEPSYISGQRIRQICDALWKRECEYNEALIALKEKGALNLAIKEFDALFDLGVRVTNCLKNANIETVAEAQKLKESEALQLPNFGRKAFKTLQAALEKLSNNPVL